MTAGDDKTIHYWNIALGTKSTQVMPITTEMNHMERYKWEATTQINGIYMTCMGMYGNYAGTGILHTVITLKVIPADLHRARNVSYVVVAGSTSL